AASRSAGHVVPYWGTLRPTLRSGMPLPCTSADPAPWILGARAAPRNARALSLAGAEHDDHVVVGRRRLGQRAGRGQGRDAAGDLEVLGDLLRRGAGSRPEVDDRRAALGRRVAGGDAHVADPLGGGGGAAGEAGDAGAV